ncbi:MAG: type II toxin-antitoxin system VapC family toxin [Bacteroidota bacterium]
MVLVDTSIWIDHLHQGDATLQQLLIDGQVVVHPFVVGELACGSLRDRTKVMGLLQQLASSLVAQHYEVLFLISRHQLMGRGLGYIDVHLLASARLSPGTQLWTRDKRLRLAAQELGLVSSYQ